MKKLLLLLSFVATSVLADLPEAPRFSVEHAVNNTDGSALTNLQETQVRCVNSATDEAIPSISIVPPLTEYSATIGEFADGSYDCTAVSLNTGGVESSPVPFLRFTVLQAPALTIPMPPTNNLVH